MTMAPGSSAYRKIAVAKETTRGTTPATGQQYYYGTIQLTPDQGFYEPDEERNSVAMLHRATPVSAGGTLRLEGSAQFETLPIVFDMALKGGVSAVVPTRANSAPVTQAKERVYSPNLNTPNAPNSYTFWYGDNYRTYRAAHVLCKNLELRYEMRNAVMLSAELFGKFPQDGGAGDAFPAVTQSRTHDLVSQKTDVYVFDPADSGIADKAALVAKIAGRSSDDEIGKVVNAINLSLPTGYEETRYMTGELDLSSFSEAKRSFEIDFTIHHSPGGLKEYNAYKSGGTRLFTLVTQGRELEAAVTGPPATPALHEELELSMACIYIESPQFFTDVNGDNCFSIKAKSIHDPKWDRDIGCTVINTIA